MDIDIIESQSNSIYFSSRPILKCYEGQRGHDSHQDGRREFRYCLSPMCIHQEGAFLSDLEGQLYSKLQPLGRSNSSERNWRRTSRLNNWSRWSVFQPFFRDHSRVLHQWFINWHISLLCCNWWWFRIWIFVHLKHRTSCSCHNCHRMQSFDCRMKWGSTYDR